MTHSLERQEIIFSGQVQGVGFRYTVQRCAERLPVTGYVRNLPDGRVHVLVEGESREINRLIGEIRRRMAGYIRDTDQRRLAPTGEFADFRIQF